MLGGTDDDVAEDNVATDGEMVVDGVDPVAEKLLNLEEKDILGEVGNISMGTSATTLFALLGQKVSITTPKVSAVKWADVSKHYDRPCVGVRVNYTKGVQGTNVLLLKHHDAKVITSLMMGWGGIVEGDDDITDMDLSATSEAMNQMIGSAATSLSSLIKDEIDIDTPNAFVVDFATHEMLEDLGFEEEYAVCVQFRMEIGNLIDSHIMQLMPISFAQHLVEVMRSYILPGLMAAQEAEAVAQQLQASTDSSGFTPQAGMLAGQPQAQAQPQAQIQPQVQAPAQSQQLGQAQAQPQYHAPPQQQFYTPPPVDARSVQFQNFDLNDMMQQKENIDIIMDVPLEVTVELGRTSKKIKEILEFSPGSVIELNKLAGEPIDILVNGKFVAKGEVVVIDENFGIRVTNIINAEYRI